MLKSKSASDITPNLNKFSKCLKKNSGGAQTKHKWKNASISPTPVVKQPKADDLLLYIDINIKSGQPPIRLPVRKSDTPEGLAYKFCKDNNIGEEIEQQLVFIFWEKMS